MSRAAELRIRTPEGISFSYVLAGPVARCAAWCIDILVLAALIMLSITLLGFAAWFGFFVFGAGALDFAGWMWFAVIFALPTGYGMFCEWFWRGQTVGKRVLGLRVIDEQGLRLQFSQVVVRNLLRAVDSLLPPGLYLVGGVSCLLSAKCQRLGDLAACTVVVRNAKPAAPDLEALMAGKYNSLREHPHLEARLRQRVGPLEASLAMQALGRRDKLEPEARTRLFTRLADHFRALVPFPEEASDGITDEQYVRNVLDVVFRPKK